MDCLNTIASTRVSDAVACVPSGCYSTLTTSKISAQPACTLGDGTQLPRVDLSCPGPGGSRTLRFRLTFSLCTKNGVIDHIEVAEDVNSRNDQKMGDVDSSVGFQALTEFGPANPVLDTSTHDKRCGECHFSRGTVSSGGHVVNVYEDIPPDRGILFTDDPAQGPPPATQTPLSVICARIEASTELAGSPSAQRLAAELCNRLALKAR